MGEHSLPSHTGDTNRSWAPEGAETRTPSLVPALQATLAAPERRRVVIPGAQKRKHGRVAQSPATAARVFGPRLRGSIVLGTLLLLLAMTLVSFVPLGSGQGRFTLFARVSNWVQTQQMDWSIQAQVAPTSPAAVPTAASGPVTLTLPKSQYVALAQQDATAAGISPTYFVRQITLESGFNPNAHSPSGAEGIAQFMPATAAGLGINPWDPVASLQAAARLMASYAREFGGDYAKALAAYNGGSATVNYAVAACGANWIGCLPMQTQRYIAIIMGG